MSLTIAQEAEYVGKDRWKWAVWIEGPDQELDEIDSVAWHLHPTFPNPVRWGSGRADKFRLDATGWGMFEIRATLYNEKGQPAGPLRHMLRFERDDGAEAPMRGVVDDKPRRVYVSASLADADVVRQLRKGLESEGYEVWDSTLDPEPGEDWRAATEKAIDQADAVLAVVMEGTVSSFVNAEIEHAVKRSKLVIPLVAGGGSLPPILADHQTLRIKDRGQIEGVAAVVADRLR